MKSEFAPIELPDEEALARCQPLVRSFYDYWERCKRGKAMPARGDIDPLDFPQNLPGIILLDVEGVDAAGHGIYRYRVVGTYEVDNRGHNPTGKLVNEGFFHSNVEAALQSYDYVRRRCVGIFEAIYFIAENGRRIQEQSVALPLSEDGEHVSQIIVYSERVLVAPA